MITSIPQSWRETHPELNEDKELFEHGGYLLKYCKVCGCSFLVGKESKDVAKPTCGKDDCDEVFK